MRCFVSSLAVAGSAFVPLKDDFKIGISDKSVHSTNLFFAVLLVSTPEGWEKEMVCFSFWNIIKVLLAEQFVVGGVQA